MACPNCKVPFVAVRGGETKSDIHFGAHFLIRGGPERVGDQVFLAGDAPIAIGKQPTNDLLITGERVSRLHAKLVPQLNGWRIEDCKSTNGLFVNGSRSTGSALTSGDRIRIGEYELEYFDSASARPRELIALSKAEAKVSAPTTSKSTADDEGIYGLADDAIWCEIDKKVSRVETVRESDDNAPTFSEKGKPLASGKLECPCCAKALPAAAQICVSCGINVKSGRSLLISQETDLDEIYEFSEQIIRFCSWLFAIGVYPIASEAFGTRKPYVIRSIAALTTVVSLWFLVNGCAGTSQFESMTHWMLWAGDPKVLPNFMDPDFPYDDSELPMDDGEGGEGETANQEVDEAADEEPSVDDGEVPDKGNTGVVRGQGVEFGPDFSQLLMDRESLPKYESFQLLTHALLHADLVHLVSNLIFLLVFGSRVNALIGHLGTIVVYPLLAIGAAAAHMESVAHQPVVPMLGASGAIMGLAGMYFVFFPLHKVHMAAWARVIYSGFQLSLKTWTVRGFWVVAFYMGFDVLYTLISVDDGTAHWAHLGGFLGGMGLASFMLFIRMVSARGGDIFSMILGKYAWGLVGRPNRDISYLQRVL